MKNISVYGVYSSRESIEEAASNLRQEGFRVADLAALLPENEGTKDLAVEKHTKAPERSVTGGIIGAVIGGFLGWLLGTGVVPLFSAMVAAGWFIGILAGMAAGGILGAVLGALAGATSPEYEIRRCKGRRRKPSLLLSVHCDNEEWMRRAKEILKRTGAQDIGARGEAKADFGISDAPVTRAPIELPSRPSRPEPVPQAKQTPANAPPRTRTAGSGGGGQPQG
jgi:hypothetical protein